jgi:hypothetical protein
MKIAKEKILEVHDICRSFQVGQEKLDVLKKVNLTSLPLVLNSNISLFVYANYF